MTTTSELKPLLKRLRLGYLLDTVFSLDFLNRHEHVLFVGPVGVGKSYLAQALGYATVRAGHSVRFIRADAFFRTLAQSRVDHTLEKTFRSFLNPDLLILDLCGVIGYVE